ncbi:MAG: aromatic ring-hydroxylating dioxygenase subunit alpha [bacterium]|nr:aromatic ring-hydroxylating dioxygenase subunit alpha [bacterium]
MPSALGEDAARGGFLPPRRFHAQEFFEFENERLWPHVWHMVGRAAEIPDPGDWVTYDLHDLSVVAIRQADHSVRAFHNVCPHRGNRLVEGRGHADRLLCGFHHWAFGLDGKLTSVPERDDLPSFSKGDYGLPPLHVEVVSGFIFAHPGEEPEPIASWLGDLKLELDLYRFEEMACFLRRNLELQCNWKTCLDAFQEVYHVRGVHPQLLPGLKIARSTFTFFGAHSMMMNPNGEESARGTGTEDDPDLLLAFRSAKAELGAIDVSHLEESRLTANYQYHLFPNITFNTHATGCQMFRFLPHASDPERCAVDIWLLERICADAEPTAEAESVHVDLAQTTFGGSVDGFVPPASARSFGTDLIEIYGLALDQDFGLLPNLQRGLHSPGLGDLVLSSQEQRIVHWNSMLDSFLEGPAFDDTWRSRCAG